MVAGHEVAPNLARRAQFVELEVHAEVSVKGTLALLGTGAQAGATGGLKFVFRQVSGKSD